MLKITAFSFVSPLIVSYVIVWLIRILAERHRILDIPNERSSHTSPVPTAGGLAIVAVTLVGAWLLVWLSASPLPMRKLVLYTAGALLLASVSLFDDLRNLPTGFRFAAHSLAAVLAIWMLGPLDTLKIPILQQVHLGWLGLPITFIWVVGLTNAYNFMDGIDGMAGVQALVAGLGWTLLAVAGGEPSVALLGLILAGGSLGFLMHNWPPARIFMGDVGSVFVGYNFAVLPLMMISAVKGSGNRDWIPVAGLFLVWPIVFDTVYTLFRRLLRGEDLFASHRSHLYQRLVVAGLGHRPVTLLYAALALSGVFLAGAFVRWIPARGWFFLLALAAEGIFLVILTKSYESGPDGRESSMARSNKKPEADRRRDPIRSHIPVVITIDAVLVFICYYLAFLLRFDFSIPPEFMRSFKESWPFVLGAKLAIFALFHLYRGMWRYTGLEDLLNVFKAVFTSSLLIIFAVLMLYRFELYPRTVFLADGFLTLVAVAGLRGIVRVYFAKGSGFEIFPAISPKHLRRKILIIGAGNTGEKAIREIRDNPRLKFDPVGILDDDAKTHGRTIHGIPVLGPVEGIARVGVDYDEILIASQAQEEGMRKIVDCCEETGKPYRIVPGIGEIINGNISVRSIRGLNLSDLLGHDEVQIDQEQVEGSLKGKRILVTGAGGSIGSELVRQACRFGPHSVGLLDHNENNLFAIEMECRQRFAYVPARSYLTDIRNREAVKRAFEDFRPDAVFHSAAFKHVSMNEEHPGEAVLNNVLGTRNLIDASIEGKVELFVLVSTDKAARPASVMGATKRVAEMLVQGMGAGGKGRFVSVRFGNVLGSTGSVVKIFEEQIARGGPLTVTHPEVVRHFMSGAEAASLIIQAGVIGAGGEVFVLNLGKPKKVLDMARDLIRLHGLEPERDIRIRFVGLRPGEKLHEEPIAAAGETLPTSHPKIMALQSAPPDEKMLRTSVDRLVKAAENHDRDGIRKMLGEIVKDYRLFEK
jgi:FlaA1/EpsC-like NDP-sugar epimerase/UDP-N-acetylmuramyl pentapeptide phosphotransferase/UDP-N-acetylglucosamine-1-phosphate transferase